MDIGRARERREEKGDALAVEAVAGGALVPVDGLPAFILESDAARADLGAVSPGRLFRYVAIALRSASVSLEPVNVTTSAMRPVAAVVALWPVFR